MGQARRDRSAAARHEAGHAVMALALGHEVLDVRLSRSGSTGVMRWTPAEPPGCIMERGMIAAAGAVAEHGYSEEPLFDAADFEDMRGMGFGGNACATLYMLARAQLVPLEAAVEHLADRLEVLGALKGEALASTLVRVRALIKSASDG